MPVANSPPASKTKNDQRRWNPRVTDTADIREDLAKHRLELLRRKLSERGLRSSPQQQAESAVTGLSDGQRRMWFVQMADPTGAILNISLSYRIAGELDVARLHNAVDAVARRPDALRP